jgi:hypothetical protein
MPLPAGRRATPRHRESARHFMVTIRWAEGYSTRVLTVNRCAGPRDHASQEKIYDFGGDEVMARIRSTSSWR